MSVNMNGTADDILRRLTNDQIAAGIRKAEAAISFHNMERDRDPWEDNSGPFPPSRFVETLGERLDAPLVRQYMTALNDLKQEQRRRAVRSVMAKDDRIAPGWAEYHQQMGERHDNLGRLMEVCGVHNDGVSPPAVMFQRCLDAIAKLKS